MKVSSSFYKGIQYIQVSSLPEEQRESLLTTINGDLFIKILVDGRVIGNCLQFKDYEKWFETVYRPTPVEGKTKAVPEGSAELVRMVPRTLS